MAEKQAEAVVAFSLIDTPPSLPDPDSAFDLGISGFLDSSPTKKTPPSKEKRLCLSSTAQKCERFFIPIESPKRLTAARGVVPVNTETSTQWALKNLRAWAQNHSARVTEPVPNISQSHDADLDCKWLCRFVMETRKTDGLAYPPATLRSLVSGVNRELQRNKALFSVLDENDARFRDLQKTLDSLSSSLHRQGLGATRNSAKVIDPVHEEMFWKKSLLGYSSPKLLQKTVFFYVGLNFVLRGVQEQHDLVPSQFKQR